jgi:hypothetical protein
VKLLLDENLPHEFRALLDPPHSAFTVTYMGWNGVPIGELLRRAAADRFGALITTDRGYTHQHNLAKLPCAIVLLLAPSNKINDLRALVPAPLAVLAMLLPRTLVVIP